MQEVDGRDVLEKYLGLVSRKTDTLITDASELPYPKEVIKDVLVHVLKTVDKGDDIQDLLRSSLISLVDFQEMNEEEKAALKVFSLPKNTSELSNAQLLEAANNLTNKSEAYNRLMAKYQQELDEIEHLLSDLE